MYKNYKTIYNIISIHKFIFLAYTNIRNVRANLFQFKNKMLCLFNFVKKSGKNSFYIDNLKNVPFYVIMNMSKKFE